MEHEASTSKIGEEQLFYCQARGITPEDATNMTANGFCKQVFLKLPMEFAVEAQKLIGVSLNLEGTVGWARRARRRGRRCSKSRTYTSRSPARKARREST